MRDAVYGSAGSAEMLAVAAALIDAGLTAEGQAIVDLVSPVTYTETTFSGAGEAAADFRFFALYATLDAAKCSTTRPAERRGVTRPAERRSVTRDECDS